MTPISGHCRPWGEKGHQGAVQMVKVRDDGRQTRQDPGLTTLQEELKDPMGAKGAIGH